MTADRLTPSPSSNVVLYDVDAAVATVVLNRPDRLNAWTPALETAYFDALQRAADDPAVRAIVVTGAGRGFCSGADLALLEDLEPTAVTGDPRRDLFPTTLPKPIIAAVNGACAGLGLAMALMCDIRIVGRTAKLTTAFSRIGLIAEHGTSWLLSRLLGHATALDLLFSSRVVDGEEAFRLGLANQVVDDDQVLATAQRYARSLAEVASPQAMATIKRQVYADANVDLQVALDRADRLVERSVQHDDFRLGVAALRRGSPITHAPLPAPATSWS